MSNRPKYSLSFRTAGGEYRQLLAIWQDGNKFSITAEGNARREAIEAFLSGDDIKLSMYENSPTGSTTDARGGFKRSNGGNRADYRDPTIGDQAFGEKVPF